MGEIGPALLLAVVGYVTLRHCANRTKFRWSALDWDQNVFESATVGVVLFAVVRAAWTIPPPGPFFEAIVRPLWPMAWAIARAIHDALPFPYSASVVGTFMLGIGGGYLSNLWWRAEKEVRRAVRDYGGDLRILLDDAAADGWPVSLTMRNRKVYVGFVLVTPGFEEPSYVTLLPTLSGYRDDKNLTLEFTTRYEHVYEDLEQQPVAGALVREDFAMVLPIANIESANRYDNDAYTRYFATPAPPPPTSTQVDVGRPQAGADAPQPPPPPAAGGDPGQGRT